MSLQTQEKLPHMGKRANSSGWKWIHPPKPNRASPSCGKMWCSKESHGRPRGWLVAVGDNPPSIMSLIPLIVRGASAAIRRIDSDGQRHSERMFSRLFGNRNNQFFGMDYTAKCSFRGWHKTLERYCRRCWVSLKKTLRIFESRLSNHASPSKSKFYKFNGDAW